jgi:Uncharacterized protein conserved in bacteria
MPLPKHHQGTSSAAHRDFSEAELFSKMELLIRIGINYLKLNKGEQGARVINEAFELVKDLPDKALVSRFYEGMGDSLFKGGAFEIAVTMYSRAARLLMSQDPKHIHRDHFTVLGRIVTSMGQACLESGRTKDAITDFDTALLSQTLFDDKERIADTLSRLMTAHTKLGNRRLAILFGKQAVNIYQESRQAINPLPQAAQKAFLRGNRVIYEQLADLLIQEGRNDEALEVINRYQDQAAFDSALGKSNPLLKLSLTPNESSAIAQYENSRVTLRSVGLNLERFLGQEEKEDREIGPLLEEAYNAYIKTSDKIQSDFEKTSLQKDGLESIDDTRRLKALLKDVGQRVGVIYTFATKDRFYVLLITSVGMKVFCNPIKAAELKAKAKAFLAALESPVSNPQKVGADIYTVIFQSTSTQDKSITLESELESYNPEVLIWSLDSALRSISVAALYDPQRKQYLAEKYETATFTRTSPEQYLRKPEPWAEGLGVGIFRDELTAIFGNSETGKEGIVRGRILFDKDFTYDKMTAAMKERRWSLVHLSSHFRFLPGRSDESYLRLGDGTRLSLADLQEKTPDLFRGVELLVLSACKSAAQQASPTGTEVDGFAELAQRLGAGSVIAGLWEISDDAALKLMSEFYQLHKKNPDWPKSKILREAQLKLLRGKVRDSKQSLSHPYYWAPFVLYGRFR